MIKILLCLVVLTCGTAAGWLKAYSYNLRVQELEDLLTVLKILLTEMEYSLTPLPKLLQEVGGKRDTLCCQLLTQTGRLVAADNETDLGASWRQAVLQVYQESSLTKEDLEVLSELGLELGRTDMLGQRSCFARTLQRLAAQLAEAEREKATKEKMYRGLGVCVGLLVTIVFI